MAIIGLDIRPLCGDNCAARVAPVRAVMTKRAIAADLSDLDPPFAVAQLPTVLAELGQPMDVGAGP